jgi:hypothetical protein
MSEAKPPTPSEESSRGLSAGLIKAGQIAGAITALITAGVVIWTQVKPAPPAPPPAALKASVTNPTILANRTWYTYFNSHPGSGALEHQRAAFRANGLTEEEINQLLRKSGFIFEFTVEVKGPPGREYTLTTELYRLPAEEAVTPINGSLPSEHFKTHAGEAGYESEENGWIEYPARAGRYLLEVELVDKEDHPIGKGRSEVVVPRS